MRRRVLSSRAFLVSATLMVLSIWNNMPQIPTMTTHALSSNRQLRILCFGDSLTAGTSPPHWEEFPYAPFLEASFPDAIVRHKGYPGWTASQLLASANDAGGLRTLIRKVQDPPLSMVILLAGTNDLGYQTSVPDIVKSIQALHEICHAEGVLHTLAIGIPPSQYQTLHEGAAAKAQHVNHLLEDYCQQSGSSTSFVPFPFAWSPDNDLWSPDVLHFSPRGYQVLGESIATLVKQILQEVYKPI